MKRLGLLLGLAVAVACQDATGPGTDRPIIPTAVRAETVVDSEWLRGMWFETQRCIGISKPDLLEEVKFYHVPGEHFRWDTMTVAGLWVGSRKEIFIANIESHPIRVMKHEILHALLFPIHGHPPEYFETGGCGNLMSDGLH